MEINVKCDWTKSEPELFFLNLPNQTKIYRFVMMTSHSCEKYDFPLQVSLFVYLFAKLDFFNQWQGFMISGFPICFYFTNEGTKRIYQNATNDSTLSHIYLTLLRHLKFRVI